MLAAKARRQNLEVGLRMVVAAHAGLRGFAMHPKTVAVRQKITDCPS